MKQKKTMLIMVVVLAVLLVLYGGGLKAWNSHSDKQKKAKRQRKVSLVDVKSGSLCLYESGGSKMSLQRMANGYPNEMTECNTNRSTIKKYSKRNLRLTAVPPS